MAPLGVNYRVFLCSVQSPELRLTLFGECLFDGFYLVFCTKPRIEADSTWGDSICVCLVQSPRLWLTVEEIGFLDYDSSLGKTLFSALYKAQGCGGLFNELSMDDSMGGKDPKC